MFADAYEKVSPFTSPLIVAVRHFNGTVTCSLGAFLFLNDEGWAITAAHQLGAIVAHQQHSKEIATFKKQVVAIEQDQRLNVKQRRKKIKRLKSNPEWITNHSLWWGRDGLTGQEFKVLAEADLAVVRLEPFDPQSIPTYPTFKNPNKLRCGTSLCRLGYPFHSISATYDEEMNQFQFPPDTFPLARFPSEGIYTRNISAGKSKNGKYEIMFLETSSPGLKGQSGGPIFDANGTVWAIQSNTRHYPLGFSPKITRQGREVEENQFLNVGLGVHPELLVQFLNDNHIKFELSDY